MSRLEQVYCRTESELANVFHDPTLNVVNAVLVSPSVVQLTVQALDTAVPPNRNGNMIISALICAFGRQKLDELFRHTLSTCPSAYICYCDTGTSHRHLLSLPLTQFFSDSIFFIKKKADPLDLDIHPAAIGSLKYEEPEGYRVADAYFLQPKSYLLSFAKENASLPTRQVSKIKGLSLKSAQLSQYINAKVMHQLVRCTMRQNLKTRFIPQQRFAIDPQTRTIQAKTVKKKLSNRFDKRFLFPSVSLVRTWAYGTSSFDQDSNNDIPDQIYLENLAFMGATITDEGGR